VNEQPLDELYLVWLYSQVADPEVEDPSLTYWELIRCLFKTEFVWTIRNDENRSEDGKELRQEFVNTTRLKGVDPNWIELGCSFLELMVGLSRRLSFEADGEPHYWFWRLLENLELTGYSDDRRFPGRRVSEIIKRVLDRKYEANGMGGLFPLERPTEDQRKVELWYQLSAYVLEQEA
jgi:hypothetical protein